MTATTDYDALVIGGGIAGASVAYFMSPHARVGVLEREAFPGMHSTGRSAALFSETYGPPQVRALTRASRAFLDRPPPGFAADALLSKRGSLIIGTGAQVSQVEAEFETLSKDTPGIRLMRTKENLDLVPVLRPESAGAAIFDADAADIDVHGLHQGFIRGLKSRGSELMCGVEIRSIEYAQGLWRLECGSGSMRAPLLINAAGAWADEVAAQAGVAPLGLEPRRRSAFLFGPPPGLATAHWPFVCAVDETFYFKPDAGMLLGSSANADPVPPHDVQPEELDIAMGIHRIEEATTMRIHRPARAWAGLRSFVADGNVVGEVAPDAHGFLWVAALGGYGLQTAPALGEACANLALGRQIPAALAERGVNALMLRSNHPADH